jgi:hypothetical protein
VRWGSSPRGGEGKGGGGGGGGGGADQRRGCGGGGGDYLGEAPAVKEALDGGMRGETTRRPNSKVAMHPEAEPDRRRGSGLITQAESDRRLGYIRVRGCIRVADSACSSAQARVGPPSRLRAHHRVRPLRRLRRLGYIRARPGRAARTPSTPSCGRQPTGRQEDAEGPGSPGDASPWTREREAEGRGPARRARLAQPPRGSRGKHRADLRSTTEAPGPRG